MNDLNKFSVETLKDGIDVYIKADQDITGAKFTVTITNTTALKGVRPLDPNIEVRNFFPVGLESIDAFNSEFSLAIIQNTKQTTNAFAASRPALTAILMTNPAFATLLDKLFCDLSYLNLVTPRNLTYSVNILLPNLSF